MIAPFYKSQDKAFTLLRGDCIALLESFEFAFDMIFADPPYGLSNGCISVEMSRARRNELDVSGRRAELLERLERQAQLFARSRSVNEERENYYVDLPF